MEDIKKGEFKIFNLIDEEFKLRMKEEKKRCLPCIYLTATAEDGRDYPAILLEEKIKNKQAYMDTIVDSLWYLLQDKTKDIKLVILKLEYRNAGVMQFCFDISPHNMESLDESLLWFRYLISSEGIVAISDGVEPTIGATGITLDLPKHLLMDRLG